MFNIRCRIINITLGQGIGKNEDGIVKPIKANLKFDNAGLSYDKASEFTNHWWERAFNSAADNLNINSSTENVSLSVKDSEAVEVTVDFSIFLGGNRILSNILFDFYSAHCQRFFCEKP